jgi:hypothetical protein
MSKTTFQELAAGRLVPLLEKGIEVGSVQLEKRDCEELLFIFRTSIPLEPFLEVFTEMINKTVADYRAEQGGENEESNGSDL